MPTEETAIKRQVRDYLALKGVLVWHNLQGLGCFRGLPDFMALHKGVFYAIEVKTKKGRLSDWQEMFLKMVLDQGGIAIVARSFEDVAKYI